MTVESMFDRDNYKLRHTTGHNMLDPESLITGAELAEGMTYGNSHRDWLNVGSYKRACSGEMSTNDVLIVAPRILNF